MSVDKQERLQNRLGPEILEFRQQCQTLQLATLNNGAPHVSYAPFAFDSNGYYILVSELAQHGRNLKQSNLVSIMMIEDESAAKSIHARRRLTFDTQAEFIDKQSNEGVQIIALLKTRFGELIDQLNQLGDFKLYRLVPKQGRYVKGFGKAFDVTGHEMLHIVHLDEGHVKSLKQTL